MEATAKDTTYQGWTNRATWAVMLHLDNEQTSYNYWRNRVASIRENASSMEQVISGVWSEEQAARFDLADQLKHEHDEEAPEELCGVYGDLLGIALEQVNWDEIATSLLDENR